MIGPTRPPTPQKRWRRLNAIGWLNFAKRACFVSFRVNRSHTPNVVTIVAWAGVGKSTLQAEASGLKISAHQPRHRLREGGWHGSFNSARNPMMGLAQQRYVKSHRNLFSFRISRYSPISHTKIPPNSRGHPSKWRQPISSRFTDCYRLQSFNNLSFDQLDRLRIEVKMKELAQPEQKPSPNMRDRTLCWYPSACRVKNRQTSAPQLSTKIDSVGHSL